MLLELSTTTIMKLDKFSHFYSALMDDALLSNRTVPLHTSCQYFVVCYLKLEAKFD